MKKVKVIVTEEHLALAKAAVGVRPRTFSCLIAQALYSALGVEDRCTISCAPSFFYLWDKEGEALNVPGQLPLEATGLINWFDYDGYKATNTVPPPYPLPYEFEVVVP